MTGCIHRVSTLSGVLVALAALAGGCWIVPESEPPEPPELDARSGSEGVVAVRVRDASGDPLSDVRVTAGEESGTTDSSGETLLRDLSTGRTVVRAAADEFTPATAVVQVTEETTARVRLQLQPEGTVAQIPASSGGEVTRDGYTVSVPENAVVDADGNSVDGSFEVELTPVRRAAGHTLPGPTDAVRTSDGSEPAAIAVLSLAHMSLRQNGVPLRIRDESSIRVEYPIPEGAEDNYETGDSIDAYWYDESSGEWVRESAGTVESRSDDGLKWVANFDHLTYYAAGTVPTGESCVEVRVLDESGSPVPRATITTETGVSRRAPSGWTRTLGTTGSDGVTCIRALRNQRLRVTVTPPASSDLETAEFEIEAADVTGSCRGSRERCASRTLRYGDEPNPDAGTADVADVGDTGTADADDADSSTADSEPLDSGTLDTTASDTGDDGTDGGGAQGSATQVTGGEYHTCALLKTGSVKCWGANRYGQLGDGTTNISETPVRAKKVSSATGLDAGQALNCVVLNNGGAKCWGKNRYGGVGDGTSSVRKVPTSVKNLSNAVDIAVGGNHACVVLASGTMKCWGSNRYGQLGNGTRNKSTTPVRVNGITSATKVVASRDFTCARLQNGELRCWGSNRYGQIGDGTTTVREVPTAVQGISDATDLAAGKAHVCAVLTSGSMTCWGLNKYSQLGDGSTSVSNTPVAVRGVSSAKGTVAGAQHTCARLTSGRATCWGLNGDGQIGVSSPNVVRTPSSVQNLRDADSLGAGFEHTCTVLDTGGVLCWGNNRYGSLGNGSRSQSSTPVAVKF